VSEYGYTIPHGFIIHGEFVPCGMHLEYIAEHIRKIGKQDVIFEDQAFAEAGNRGWIRLSGDVDGRGADIRVGGVDFLGRPSDRKLKIVQRVFEEEDASADLVQVEGLKHPIPFDVFMSVKSIDELEYIAREVRSPYLGDAWARKAARERGLETNPRSRAFSRVRGRRY
jgi:hypothetical protein